MNHQSCPINTRRRKTFRPLWFAIAAGILTMAIQISLADPLASQSVALGQAAMNEPVSAGRFEAIQVGTTTATLVPIATSPSTPPPQSTAGPGATATPSETATPTTTSKPGSPAGRETPAPAASPTATQASLGTSLTTATPPPSATDATIPAVEPTSQATAKPPAPVIGATGAAPTAPVPMRGDVPTQSQPPGTAQGVTATPSSLATQITPGATPTSTGGGSSPFLLVLGGMFIVGIGVIAYFIGRRG